VSFTRGPRGAGARAVVYRCPRASAVSGAAGDRRAKTRRRFPVRKNLSKNLELSQNHPQTQSSSAVAGARNFSANFAMKTPVISRREFLLSTAGAAAASAAPAIVTTEALAAEATKVLKRKAGAVFERGGCCITPSGDFCNVERRRSNRASGRCLTRFAAGRPSRAGLPLAPTNSGAAPSTKEATRSLCRARSRNLEGTRFKR
jgi:hypothetical protein